MASGKFKLFYKNRTTENACADVHYRVESAGHGIAASGITDSKGETDAFVGRVADAKHTLTVRDGDTGDWVRPDMYSEADSDNELTLGKLDDQSLTTQRLRVKPYFKVQYLTHPGRKPIVGAKFTAYALDSNGREAIAKDLDRSANVTGKTDARGETGVVYSGSNLVFKFELPGTSIKVSSKRFPPTIRGQTAAPQEVPFKTVTAMTAAEADHQAHLAGKTSAPLLISPQDQELIMVPQSDFDEFEEMSGRLEKIMEASHLAKLDLSRALDAQSASDIAAAEKALKLAESKVKSELNKNFSKLTDLKEVVTLESYSKGKSSATGAGQFGLRRRYLKTDKYLQLKNKRLNKTEYKLTIKTPAHLGTAQKTQTVKAESVDLAELKKSFSKISTSVATKKELKADPKVLNLIDLAGNEFSESLLKSETYQVEANAQWLRLVGGAGASAGIDWGKRKLQLQGNLQGKIVLCEGKMTAQWATPSLKGWMMSLAGEDMGAIRFVLKCEFYGFAGAKIVATGTIGVTLEGGKQVVKAIKNDDKDSYIGSADGKSRLPRFDPAALYAKPPEDLNGVKAEIDAFAGVEAGITPGGSIQWLPPQEKEFVSFAEIAATGAVSAGAGVAAQFAIYLDGGKFRVKASAKLCVGLGCKGAVEFTVDGNKVLEFAKWVAYQLLNEGFRTLVYFSKRAFDALSQLMLLCVVKGSPGAADIERFTAEIDAEFASFQTDFAQAKTRQAMVDNINRTPDWLKFATPETRGMLLYQITRHSKFTHARDMPSANLSEGSWTDPEIHYLPLHKQAICNVVATIQTAACWDNVMQHMSAAGSKTPRGAGSNEGDVLRVLNDGVSLANLPSVFEGLNESGPVMRSASDKKGSGNKYLDRYLTMRAKLMDKFPKGYKIARLDSSQFDLLAAIDGGRHPEFGEIRTAGLGEAMPGDPGALYG